MCTFLWLFLAHPFADKRSPGLAKAGEGFCPELPAPHPAAVCYQRGRAISKFDCKDFRTSMIKERECRNEDYAPDHSSEIEIHDHGNAADYPISFKNSLTTLINSA